MHLAIRHMNKRVQSSEQPIVTMTSGLDQLTRLYGDWRALLRTRANVLVTGPRHLLEAFGGACHDDLRQPVGCISTATPLRFHPSASLVIIDVHLFDAGAQAALAAWMSDAQNVDTQIISLSPEHLFGRVRAGQFDADLYYRLNTIHLRLTDSDA